MRTHSLMLALLAIIAVGVVAQEEADTTCSATITCTVKRHPITVLHPNGRGNCCHGAIHVLPQCDIHERYQDYYGVSLINRLVAIACILCAFILAHVAYIGFRHLVSREANLTLDGAQSRGRQNKTIAAPVPTKNHLKPQDSVPTGLATLSNEAEAKANPSGCDDTLAPTLVAYESQAGEIYETIRNDATHLEGTTQKVSAPGTKRGANDALRQSFPPVTEGARLDFSQPGFYRSFAYLVDRITATVTRYRFIPRFNKHPLVNSLYGYDPTLSIFAIAGDDADEDLAALHQALMESHSGNVRFASFSRNIALDCIEAEVEKLYDECRGAPDTHLFVYLTGHGDRHNNMIISESKSISEAQLFELLSAGGPVVDVTLLFDICRPANVPSAAPPSGISLIRACSPEEIAGACRTPDYKGPNSCFLNALMISACTLNLPCTTEALQKEVQERLDQLIIYLEEVYTIQHPAGRCRRCSGDPTPCDRPRRQNIDWGDAGDMHGLLKLTKILSESEIAKGVCQRFMRDELFCKINNLPRPVDEGCELTLLMAAMSLSSPILDFSPLPEDNTIKHERGANDHVHEGRPPGIE